MTEQRDFNKDREICNVATEGPWSTVPDQAFAVDASHDYLDAWSIIDSKGRSICVDIQDFSGIEDDETAGPNLQFIAAAREGWPAALDEIERLRRENSELRKATQPVPEQEPDIYNCCLDRISGEMGFLSIAVVANPGEMLYGELEMKWLNQWGVKGVGDRFSVNALVTATGLIFNVTNQQSYDVSPEQMDKINERLKFLDDEKSNDDC